MRTTLAITFLAALAGGCKKQNKAPPATGSGSAMAGSAVGSGSGSADLGSGSADPGSGSAAAAPPMPLPPGAVRVQGEFATPESVLHDTANDVYLVANINGAPNGADDNGFISKVSPDGTVVTLKWIDGAAEDIALDAPKGMAIAGGMLYVADITRVRKFDLKTGKAAGDIVLPGATFVNDVVASPDGKTIYATDTGVDGSFAPNGTDAVWKIAGDKPVALAKDKALGNPNGIVTSADGSAVWIATFGTGELREISGKGELKGATKLPKGKLDGIVWVGDTLLVSSWESSTVYQGKPGGAWQELVTGVEAPADIGYDSKRKLVLVPRFMANDVLIIATK